MSAAVISEQQNTSSRQSSDTDSSSTANLKQQRRQSVRERMVLRLTNPFRTSRSTDKLRASATPTSETAKLQKPRPDEQSSKDQEQNASRAGPVQPSVAQPLPPQLSTEESQSPPNYAPANGGGGDDSVSVLRRYQEQQGGAASQPAKPDQPAQTETDQPEEKQEEPSSEQKPVELAGSSPASSDDETQTATPEAPSATEADQPEGAESSNVVPVEQNDVTPPTADSPSPVPAQQEEGVSSPPAGEVPAGGSVDVLAGRVLHEAYTQEKLRPVSPRPMSSASSTSSSSSSIGEGDKGDKAEDSDENPQQHTKDTDEDGAPELPPRPQQQDDDTCTCKKHNKTSSKTSSRGDFSLSALRICLSSDHDLVAECRTIAGDTKLSVIALERCLMNYNGQFRWARNGNFGVSARDVKLTRGGRFLEAELRTRGGEWQKAEVCLDERLENCNGDLRMV